MTKLSLLFYCEDYFSSVAEMGYGSTPVAVACSVACVTDCVLVVVADVIIVDGSVVVVDNVVVVSCSVAFVMY